VHVEGVCPVWVCVCGGVCMYDCVRLWCERCVSVTEHGVYFVCVEVVMM